MQVHSNATTNKKQREKIRTSPKSCRQLGRELEVSPATVHRWKHRDTPEDHSCARKQRGYRFDACEQELLLGLRAQQRTLDEVMDVVTPLMPSASRTTVYRLFKRREVGRLASKQQQETGQSGCFKEYPPGYVHIDCFYLPQLEGKKHYCFVAIDRATRLSFLAVYEHKDKLAAADFLNQCLAFYPFQLHTILTDNGREFTLAGFKNRYGTAVKTVHPVAQICLDHQIEQRTTKPYTPKTNGLVERMNGLTKENTTKIHRYTSVSEMKTDLNQWLIRYNFYRPHRRIGNKIPYEAMLQWHDKQPELFTKEPTEMLKWRNSPFTIK